MAYLSRYLTQIKDSLRERGLPVPDDRVIQGILHAFAKARSKTSSETAPKCHDCAGPNDLYMVRDEIWAAIWAPVEPRKGLFLCFGCLEARLGRQLALSDFTPAPINNGLRFAWGRDA